jgi:pyruvate formate lyase activating enzyme
MQENSGLVFDIQRFSINDGPGIRTTVFLSGCTLRCKWCSNPESNSGKAELFYNPQRCIGCQSCVEICPKNAVNPGIFDKKRIDRIICDGCGECARVCPAAALILKGELMDPEQVMDVILRDKPFYDNNGGVTFSGGEPFFQYEYLLALATVAKQYGLNTVVETAGHVPWQHIEPVLPYLDLIYYDFKHPDSKTHQRFTGAGNELIYENLIKIVKKGTPLIVRILLIPGFNTSREILQKSASILHNIGVKTVEFLHYHTLGESKYAFLGKDYDYTTDNSGKEERAKLALDIFKDKGIDTILDA